MLKLSFFQDNFIIFASFCDFSVRIASLPVSWQVSKFEEKKRFIRLHLTLTL